MKDDFVNLGCKEAIGEQGGGSGGSTPSEKIFYDPPLRFKMTPTPSEMAFDPL